MLGMLHAPWNLFFVPREVELKVSTQGIELVDQCGAGRHAPYDHCIDHPSNSKGAISSLLACAKDKLLWWDDAISQIC